MNNIKGYVILFLLFWAKVLVAEVEEIVIRWNAFTCLEVCIPRLERNLNSITHVRNLQINSRSGTAVMGWDPNFPFTYWPFRYASGAAGIHFSDFRLRIRGNIAHDTDNFYLVSIGDGSRYLILGPLIVEPGRYTPPFNLETHPLTASMKLQLHDAELRGQTVIISGPLFLPNRFPRTIIAQQIQISEESTMDPRYQR